MSRSEPATSSALTAASVSASSYEIICADARIAPNSEYFVRGRPSGGGDAVHAERRQREDHEDADVDVGDDRLEPPSALNRVVRPNIVVSCSRNGRPHGTTAIVVSAGRSPNAGASVYSHLCACAGMMSSLMKNFAASAIDWKSPSGPTRFGPGRS